MINYRFQENGCQFTEGDISIFEAFAIFCGLGIHNTQMYENACKLMAKQKVPKYLHSFFFGRIEKNIVIAIVT